MNARVSLLLSLSLLSSSLFASPGAHGPNGEHLDQNTNKVAGGPGRQADGSVIMPMKHQALLNITTQFVVESEATRHIRLDGLVKPHPKGYAKVQPSSDGRLDAPKDGLLTSGSEVKVGDILGYIRYQDTAYELASQTSELIVIRNQIQQNYRDVARLKKLGDLASKQQLEQLETQLSSLKQQEQALQQGLEKPEALIAPISGVLVNHSVSTGQWVEAGETLFEIVATDKFLIEATTNEIDLINKLGEAHIETSNKRDAGVVLSYLGHSPQVINGLIHVNFETVSTSKESLPKVSLLLNQNVTVKAPLLMRDKEKSEDTIKGIVLPAKAVVLSSNNLPQVWIKVSAERFLPQIVEYKELEPGVVLITNGLGSDNRVVVEGTSLLNQVR